MKAYQWLTLSEAIVLTDFEAPRVTSARRVVSSIETQAAAGPWVDSAATAPASEQAESNRPSKFGKAP